MRRIRGCNERRVTGDVAQPVSRQPDVTGLHGIYPLNALVIRSGGHCIETSVERLGRGQQPILLDDSPDWRRRLPALVGLTIKGRVELMRRKRTSLGNVELPGPEDSFFETTPETAEDPSGLGEIDGSWAKYSSQYERASHRLIESNGNGEMLIYPAVFMYRHFLELRLKAILALGVVIEHVEEEKPNAREHATSILNTHSLTSLTEGCRKVCDRVGLLRNAAFAASFVAFEGCIQELAAIDPGSYAFRYPTDKRLQPAICRPLRIDPVRLTRTMDRIAALLRITWMAVNRKSCEVAPYEDGWSDEEEECNRKDLLGIDEWEAEREADES